LNLNGTAGDVTLQKGLHTPNNGSDITNWGFLFILTDAYEGGFMVLVSIWRFYASENC
jgi:hypothetical protein